MAITIKNDVMQQYKDALALDRQREQALVRAEQTRQTVDTPKAKVSDWQVAGETVADILGNVVVGAQKGLEGIYDFGATLVGAVGGIFDKDFQKDVQEHVARNLTEETTGKALREATQNSAVYNLSDKGQAIVRGVSQGVGQMLPSVAVTAVTGGLGATATLAQTAGMLTLGASAAGSSTEEAFNEGASYNEAMAYGVLSGALEMATERLVGGAWEGVFGKGLADSAIKKVVSGATQNKVLQKGLKVLLDSAGEGAEEMVSEIVSPYLKRMTYDKQADSATVESVVEAGLIGALTSLAYGGAQTAVKKVAGVNTVIPSELENVANYDEALKKGWDSNDKATVEKVSQAKAETLKTISQELANMSDDKRAKYIDKHNLGAMFNADGTLTDNYNNAYNGNMELARAYDTRYVSMGVDSKSIESDLATINEDNAKRYAQINNVSIEEAREQVEKIKVYSGELGDKATQDLATAKQAVEKLGSYGMRNLKLVVVDENQMFNGNYNGTDNNIYIAKDTLENGNWVGTLIHEVMHSVEKSGGDYNQLSAHLRFVLNEQGKLDEIINGVAKLYDIDGQVLLKAIEKQDNNEQLSQEEKNLIELFDSELNAKLAEEVLGNEDFINRIVKDKPNLAKRIVETIQNIIKVFKMNKVERRQYSQLLTAERLYLKAAYNTPERQALAKMIEQGIEENKQIKVEVGVDQTLALQYNKKEQGTHKKKGSYYSQFNTTAMQWAFSDKRKVGDFKVLYNADNNTWNKLIADNSESRYYIDITIEDTPKNAEAIRKLHDEVYNDNNGEKQRVGKSVHNDYARYWSCSNNIGDDNINVEEQDANGQSRKIYRGKSESDGRGNSKQGNRNKRAVDYHFNDDGSQIVTYSDGTKKKNYSLKDTVEKDVLSHYGATYRWTETGYILKDGTRLDLSGRRDGASGGYRTVDHRDIFDIYENVNGTEAMIEFMARGNIRVSPENPGINLQVEPTEEQYRLIQDFVERVGFKEEYFSVDFDDKFGDVVETLEYNGKVSGRKVVSDIRYYFKEGKLPYRSELSQFRWSLKESFEQGLNKYSESEIASIESNKMFKVARSYEDVKEFIETSRKGTINQRLFIGKISDATATKIFDKIGISVVGKSLALSSADIRHIFIKHGTNGTEMTRGQVAITQENFENIIDTLIEPDTVARSDENNMVGLKFQKEIGGRVTAITVMSEKRKALTLKSAWIQKEKQHISPPSNAEALNITSETLQSMDAVSNNSISKIEENVNTDDKNTPKYSRKSPAPSQVGDIIKAKGNLTTDKIFTKDEAKKIIAEIEERLVFEEKGKIGTVKGTNELIDRLWKGLNKADKGEYTRVGVEIADYVIKNSVVEDMYECLYGDVEVDEAREVIKTLKQYFHKVKISDRVLGEIKHHFDDKASKVLSLWRAKEGGLAPDQIAQEIEKTGYISSDNDSQIFIEMVEAYNKAVETVNRKSEIALNSVLDSKEIYQLRQDIISAVLDGKNAYGKDSTLTKLKEQVNQDKQNYRTAAKKIYERNYAANHALYKVQQIQDLKNHRFVNSATPKADTFKAILSQLSRIKYAGNLNESGTRKIFKKINEWYTSDNAMLGYVEGSNVGATLFDAQLKADIESIANGEERKRLTVEEIRLVDKVLTRLYTLMVNDSRIFRAGRWVDAESKAQDYIAIDKANTEIKKTYRFAWFGKLLEKLGKWRDMILDPASVVRYHDAYNEKGFWTETYEELRKAAQDQAIMEMNFKEPIEKFLEQHKGFLNDAATREIDYNGQKIVVQNAMLLYMSFKRSNAQAGLVRNGFAVYDKDGNKIVYDFIKETTDLNEIEEIAKAQEQALYKQFTQAEKEYIALWEKAFNEDCKKAKEKTDIIRMGGSNVTDGYYVPIKRYGAKQEELGNIIYDELESLNNASFNKNTVQNSHMLLIGNLHDVGLRHINGITKYATLQIPMDNFKRLYNTDLSKFFGGENLNRGKRLGDMLDWQAKGKNGGGLEYLNDLILSMAGIRAKTDVFSSALGKIRGNTAVGVLALNPKVLFTQLSSYLASGHILSVNSLVRGAMLSGKDVDGYSDLAKLRNYDGTAYLARTLTTEFTGKFAKFKEKLMLPISKMDRLVIQRLFASCQVEIDKTQGLKLGSEENKNEAGKLLNKIILETQQNTLMTEKSALMRSTSELAKTATMFTSDLMKNIGRWIDSIGKSFVLKKRLANAKNATDRATIEAEIKANNKQIRKSTSTMNALAVYGAIVAMLFSHFFGTNDEDETFGEEFLGEFMSTWVGGIPILKDIYNYFNSGYEMQDFTLGSINDVFGGIADFANGIEKYNETGEIRQLLSGTRKLAFSSANAFGLPLKNLYKMTYGGINILSPSAAYKIDDTFYKQPYSKDLAKALAKDDDIMISTITELMLQDKSGGNFSDGTREEINRLVNQLGDTSFLPKSVNQTFSFNKEQYTLTSKEFKQAKAEYEKANQKIDDLIAKSGYKTATDEEKAAMIKFVYDYYYEQTIVEAIGADKSKTLLFASGIKLEDMAIIVGTAKVLEADKDRNGNAIAGSKKKKIVAMLQRQRLTADQKYLMLAYLGYSTDMERVERYVNRLRLTKDEKKALLEECA